MINTQNIRSVKFYSIGEEIGNAVTHGVGALLSAFGLLLLLFKAEGPWQTVSSCIYGGSLVLLFTMSCLYHALSNERAKRIMRIFDHTSIFVLIAGTYTPYTLVTFRGPLGWALFGFVWGTAVLGIILNSISIERFKKFSMACYVVAGWCVVLAVVPLIRNLALPGLLLLLGGGILYTGGIFFYRQKSVRWFHMIWHIFVLAAAVLQYFSIYGYVMG